MLNQLDAASSMVLQSSDFETSEIHRGQYRFELRCKPDDKMLQGTNAFSNHFLLQRARQQLGESGNGGSCQYP